MDYDLILVLGMAVGLTVVNICVVTIFWMRRKKNTYSFYTKTLPEALTGRSAIEALLAQIPAAVFFALQKGTWRVDITKMKD